MASEVSSCLLKLVNAKGEEMEQQEYVIVAGLYKNLGKLANS